MTTPGPAGAASCLPSRLIEQRAWAQGETYTGSEMTSNASKPASREVYEPPVTIATLREIALFGALSDEVVDRLARTLRTLRVIPGDTIFREGDGEAREMYVVLDGEMEVSKRSRRGRDVRVAILGPNDCFGEMSMIDMQTRSATVRAVAPSRLVTVTSEDMDALYRSDLKSYALIVLNIARDLSRRLRVTDGILADFTVNVLDEYVAAKRA
jgi:CRP/FNR family cyclic AMP-dependent transcriptional regulator